MIKKLLSPPKWVRWLVSLFLIALLLYISDFLSIYATIVNASWVWLIVALVTAIFLTFYAAFKWWVLMPRGSATISVFVRVSFVGNFVGIFFPGIVGIEAARIAGITQSTSDFPAALTSVLVDRLFGLLTLVLLVIGSAAVSTVVPEAIGVVSLICLAVLIAVSIGILNPSVRNLFSTVLSGRFSGSLQKIYDCIDIYKTRPMVLIFSLVLAFVYQLGRVLLVYFLARSLTLEIPSSYLLVVVPVTFFVQMLPISIYGIGVRESALVGLLAIVGISTEEALSLGLLMFGVIIAATLPGGILMAMGNTPLYGSKKRPEN